MNNFFELTKVDFLGSFDIRKKQKKDAKATTFKVILATVVVLGLILSTLYNFIFIEMFYQTEQPLYYPMMMFAGLTGLLTLMTSVTKVKGIYTGKDYEMLKAMPVRRTEIVGSKIVSLYLVELLYSAIILVPNTIICTVLSGNLLFILTGFIAVFLAPAIPMLLACLIAMFISLVADRYKFGNIFNVIFYIIFFGAMMWFSVLMNTASSKIDAEGNLDMTQYLQMAEVFGWMNPTTQLLKLTFTTNFMFVFVYVIANAVLIVAVVAFLALFYDTIHALVTQEIAKEVYVAKDLETKSQFKTLFAHEAKRLFTSKYYFMNTIASVICSVMMAGVMGFMFSPYTNMIPVGEEFRTLVSNYAYIGFIVIAFGVGISNPASCSISFEGKNFWILKSTPVDYKKLLKAKFLLSVLVMAPVSVVASIVLCVLLKANLVSYIAMPLLTLVYAALTSIVGLKINLDRPKLKWSNEQEVVKNSSAVVLTMFADWGIMLVITGSLLGLAFVNSIVACAVCFVVQAVIFYAVYSVMMKNATKYFDRIEEF